MNLSFLRKTIPVDFYDFPGLSLEVPLTKDQAFYNIGCDTSNQWLVLDYLR
ncbi:hypothetical protein BRARA_I02749 [Brassica rapa]|uniref:Uncharacterized protein n=1 Tax=Brassica campestris TaxID=3711 RepID=A0A397XXG5_BRACM|nr:hypothetical protein BRARA_I02749 [Brassica rapa]